MAKLSITRQERAAQPLLLIRREIPRSELPTMLAECFGKLFAYGAQAGLPIAGPPTARYVAMSWPKWIVEAAMPLASKVAGKGDMVPGELQGGPVAIAVHEGAYDTLPQTNGAVEQWIKDKGLKVGGAPWESYVTDPGEHPNPADWRTEVCWPIG